MTEPDWVINLRQVGKAYPVEPNPWRRLGRQLLGRSHLGPVHRALHDVTLQVKRGEVIGVLGRNGAGKSTLLQLVSGVLQPSQGQCEVRGRVAALLELGAGFNPELTGRENLRFNAPLMGLSAQDMERLIPEIVEFADIGPFIDQPVRSYSSGMFVRLAFSMATAVEPDILIIDEALSVGDGVFARRSFDRIMGLKERGATVLFCSHSTYHVESLCSRVIWLDAGCVRRLGPAADVVAAYNEFIGSEAHGMDDRGGAGEAPPPMTEPDPLPQDPHPALAPAVGQGRLLSLQARAGDQVGRRLKLHCGHHDLELDVAFQVDPALPAPSVIMALNSRSGSLVASAGTHNDGVVLTRDAQGRGQVTLRLPRLPLLKGEYVIHIYLACERGLHYYVPVLSAFELDVTQDGLEQGFVTLEHQWISQARPN